jgi:hypothetical protein
MMESLKMRKKVKFYTTNADLFIDRPIAAKHGLPTWFQNLKGVVEGTRTMKSCPPFLDAMSMGYHITLSADIYIHKGELQQISVVPVVVQFSENTVDTNAIPDEFIKAPFQLQNFFITETPKGYSSLLVQPLNRTDLPFMTMAGVVETDKFPAPIKPFFFIRKDFSGVIKEGTPIAQVIPFKREAWTSEVHDKATKPIPQKFLERVNNPPFDFYKKHFWKTKRYE